MDGDPVGKTRLLNTCPTRSRALVRVKPKTAAALGRSRSAQGYLGLTPDRMLGDCTCAVRHPIQVLWSGVWGVGRFLSEHPSKLPEDAISEFYLVFSSTCLDGILHVFCATAS